MKMNPADIRQQQFTLKLFRGFDVTEVDNFLEEVALDFEDLLRENNQLKEELSRLEERIQAVEEREKILKETLIATNKLSEEMKENAKKEAQLVIKEAQVNAENIIESVRTEEARIRNEINELKRQKRLLAERLKMSIDMYLRMVEENLLEDGNIK